MNRSIYLVLSFFACSVAFAQELRSEDPIVFEDKFQVQLDKAWRWVRENPKAIRISEEGMKILVQPGNMWGGQNNAKNVLVRAAPDPATNKVEASLLLENQPTNQYEQVNLVWYYDDSNMVKLGQELVDGKLSIVMGREEKDQTRTIAIIPLDTFLVEVRLVATDDHLLGEFRKEGSGEWVKAGECDMPKKPGATPNLSIQCYQGPPDAEHWASLKRFRMATTPAK